LLGTILGIFDTFTALAKSGISDPQGVSAGIGTALLQLPSVLALP
jgi:biopolymer transport protein ExbB